MKSENYKKNIKNFAILIGYLKIAMELESYSDVYNEYKDIIDNISNWAKNYSLKESFDDITYEKSLKIHTLIDDIREKKLFDKTIGEESFISDQIIIWYEILVKGINDEIEGNDGKR